MIQIVFEIALLLSCIAALALEVRTRRRAQKERHEAQLLRREAREERKEAARLERLAQELLRNWSEHYTNHRRRAI